MKPSVGWHEIGTATIRSVEHNQRICKAQATYRNIFDLRAVVHEKVYGAALGCCEEPSVGKIQQCFAKIRKHLQTL
jgi:hypothetical protein